jgi:hypothetical protein
LHPIKFALSKANVYMYPPRSEDIPALPVNLPPILSASVQNPTAPYSGTKATGGFVTPAEWAAMKRTPNGIIDVAIANADFKTYTKTIKDYNSQITANYNNILAAKIMPPNASDPNACRTLQCLYNKDLAASQTYSNAQLNASRSPNDPTLENDVSTKLNISLRRDLDYRQSLAAYRAIPAVAYLEDDLIQKGNLEQYLINDRNNLINDVGGVPVFPTDQIASTALSGTSLSSLKVRLLAPVPISANNQISAVESAPTSILPAPVAAPMVSTPLPLTAIIVAPMVSTPTDVPAVADVVASAASADVPASADAVAADVPASADVVAAMDVPASDVDVVASAASADVPASADIVAADVPASADIVAADVDVPAAVDVPASADIVAASADVPASADVDVPASADVPADSK